MINKFVVDGRFYFFDLEAACDFAEGIYNATGVIVAVEKVQ